MRPVLKLYVGIVIGSAIGLVAFHLLTVDSWPHHWNIEVMLVLLLLGVAAERLQFEVHPGTATHAGTVPHIATAFLLPPGIAELVAAISTGIYYGYPRRGSFVRAAFNTASTTLSVGAASQVATAFGGPNALRALATEDAGWLGPPMAALATAAYVAVTVTVVARAASLDRQVSFWRLVRGRLGVQAITEIGLGLLGATLAMLILLAPGWAPALLFPGLLVFMGKKAMDRADRRLRDLALTSSVGRAVAATLKPDEAFEVIASTSVRETLRVSGLAFMPLGDPPGFQEHVSAEQDEVELRQSLVRKLIANPRRITLSESNRGDLEEFPTLRGRAALVVAIPFGAGAEKNAGVLMAWRTAERSTFSSEEIMLLETLADYAAVALETARLAAAEAYQEVQALHEVARLKDEFVGQVSHELRTPLATIHGFNEMVALGLVDDPDRIRKIARASYESSTLMMRLVEDLLEMAHLDSGGLALKRESVDVAAWLERTAAAFASSTSSHHLNLSGIPATLPLVMADLSRLAQVLNNLLSNAVRYAPVGSTIHVAAAFLPHSREVEIRVTDEGPGIAIDEHERIFEKFYRGKNGALHRVRGTGLGLAVAHALVEAHHGTIGVDSDLGRGASFWLRLPTVGSDPPKPPSVSAPRLALVR